MRSWQYLFLSGLCVVAQGPKPPLGEYAAKVVLLERITRFVEWPAADKVNGGHREFLLGVVGQNPFGDELDTYFLNHQIKGRPVRIRYFKGPGDLRTCDLLFISASENTRLKDILAKLGSAATLTIGDSEGFAVNGVMVNITRDNDHLGFEVNLTAAREGRIRLASGFLQIAKVIN